MTNEELDRVVSRRVDHPTAATPEDEKVYRAAEDPSSGADTDAGGAGGAAERAARSAETDGDEPTRSE